MQRLTDTYNHVIWLNPEPEKYWEYTPSIQVVQEVLGEERMFPMTLEGLDRAMRRLR